MTYIQRFVINTLTAFIMIAGTLLAGTFLFLAISTSPIVGIPLAILVISTVIGFVVTNVRENA